MVPTLVHAVRGCQPQQVELVNQSIIESRRHMAEVLSHARRSTFFQLSVRFPQCRRAIILGFSAHGPALCAAHTAPSILHQRSQVCSWGFRKLLSLGSGFGFGIGLGFVGLKHAHLLNFLIRLKTVGADFTSRRAIMFSIVISKCTCTSQVARETRAILFFLEGSKSQRTDTWGRSRP